MTLYLALAGMVLIGTAHAHAVPIHCSPWPDLKALLLTKYHEAPVSGGIVNPNAVLQVLASPGGESWTAVVIGINGMACIISAGKGWEPGLLAIKGEVPG